MNTPAVGSWFYTDAATGYTNNVGLVTASADNNLHFNFTMSFGIGPLGIDNFENMINPNNIVLLDSSGATIATLGGDYMTLAQVTTTNLEVLVDASGLNLDDGTYTLQYTSEFSAGNTNNPPLRTLGVPVNFVFNI